MAGVTVVIAHRGSSGIAPENSAVAIEAAIAQGADFVEVDIQPTRDGALVNHHDATLERTTDARLRFPGRPSYRVSDFDLAELKRLDIGGWFHPAQLGERMCTLAEVVALVRGRVGLLVEISPVAHHRGTGLPTAVARELASLPGFVDEAVSLARLVVQSFHADDAREFGQVLPDVPLAWLTDTPLAADDLAELATWASAVNPHMRLVDAGLVRAAHRVGLRVNPWTVDEPGRMRQLLGLGVDGLITDYPQSLTQRA
jgi:glycerophosphoryl diester phosphodiesterase